MPLDAKRELIKEAAETFVVLAETGVKDAEAVLPTRQWRDEIAATSPPAPPGSSPRAGRAAPSGSTTGPASRPDIIDAAVAAAGVGRVLFEAPRKASRPGSSTASARR